MARFVLWKGARAEAIGGLKLVAKLLAALMLLVLLVAIAGRAYRASHPYPHYF